MPGGKPDGTLPPGILEPATIEVSVRAGRAALLRESHVENRAVSAWKSTKTTPISTAPQLIKSVRVGGRHMAIA